MENLILGTVTIFVLLITYMALTEMWNFLQTRVPFVPTSKEDLVDLVNRVGITEKDFVLDLGSGNGKVLFTIEKETGAKTMGIQRTGWTQVYGKLRKFLTGSKTKLISGNFFDHSWSEATIVYGYLYPFLMSQVGEKALGDCRSGTKIISRDFPIPNLKMYQTWETPTFHQMYLYII